MGNPLSTSTWVLWRPREIGPRDWDKEFVKVDNGGKLSLGWYAHRKDTSLQFPAYDVYELNREGWIRLCRGTLYRQLWCKAATEQSLLDKWGDIMGEKEIREFVWLYEGDHLPQYYLWEDSQRNPFL